MMASGRAQEPKTTPGDPEMRPVAALMSTAILCAACASSPPKDASTTERRVQYQCANGEQIEVRFFPVQGVGVLVKDGATIELQQQPSGSGFIYSDGRYTLRGKGDELLLETGRMVPLTCRTRP
jgi:membrane-bound inhibitor of C-type lysozyme